MNLREEDGLHDPDAWPPYVPWLHDPEESGVWCYRGEDDDAYLRYDDDEGSYEQGLTIPRVDAEETMELQGSTSLER
jgi:hypothetical protein